MKSLSLLAIIITTAACTQGEPVEEVGRGSGPKADSPADGDAEIDLLTLQTTGRFDMVAAAKWYSVESVTELLPPGTELNPELIDDSQYPVLIQIGTHRELRSTVDGYEGDYATFFGYRELMLIVPQVKLEGGGAELFSFLPKLYLDREPPITAGVELYGFNKHRGFFDSEEGAMSVHANAVLNEQGAVADRLVFEIVPEPSKSVIGEEQFIEDWSSLFRGPFIANTPEALVPYFGEVICSAFTVDVSSDVEAADFSVNVTPELGLLATEGRVSADGPLPGARFSYDWWLGSPSPCVSD